MFVLLGNSHSSSSTSYPDGTGSFYYNSVLFLVVAPRKPVGAVSVLPVAGLGGAAPLLPANGPAKQGRCACVGVAIV